MSRDHTSEGITTPEEFETALGQLLRSAVDNGVNPRGSWVINGDGAGPDWETMVFELDSTDASG